jgi:hypothetical protein
MDVYVITKWKLLAQELVIFILNKCDVLTDSNSFLFSHRQLHKKKNQLAQTHLGQSMNNLIYFQSHTI